MSESYVRSAARQCARVRSRCGDQGTIPVSLWEYASPVQLLSRSCSNRILLWASPEDAIAKYSKADSGIVVCLGSVVEMNVQQCIMFPYQCRNGSD